MIVCPDLSCYKRFHIRLEINHSFNTNKGYLSVLPVPGMIGASGGLTLIRFWFVGCTVGTSPVNAVKRYSRSLRRAAISNWSCSA